MSAAFTAINIFADNHPFDAAHDPLHFPFDVPAR